MPTLHLNEAAAPGTEPRPLRVLLIEDDPDDALLLRRHLSKVGFEPEILRVETEQAMLAALEEHWDCVLADYNLPKFSAPEALRLLQSTGHDIPFIMMSGAVSEATAVEAMRAGAHDYVSKENLTRLGPAIEREIAEAAGRRTRLAAERALLASEERFHRLVEAAPLALLISDVHGRVSYSNRGAHRLLGLSPAAAHLGSIELESIFETATFGPMAEEDDANHHIARGLHRTVKEHDGDTWETSCCHTSGDSVPVLIGTAILNPEALFDDRQLAIFFVDLTEQKQSNEVLRRTEKLAAAGRLAASIAHEINNPLEAIVNCLYLVENSSLSPETRSYLSMAQRELTRVTHITTQTLRFYRQSTNPVKTAVGDLIDSILSLYEARIRDHGIEVVSDYDNVLTIQAMDGEIRQVIANLVGNAIDAMHGQPEPRILTLRARHALRGETRGISILVADRGCGISPSTLKRLFEPFFSTKGITGTGLGLWVSREIVSKHNGSIHIRTSQKPPTGSIFRLFLPLASPQAEPPPA